MADILSEADEYGEDDDRRDEGPPQELSVYLSEDGMKAVAGTDYHTRFKDVAWTSNAARELPVKLARTGLGSEPPLTVS